MRQFFSAKITLGAVLAASFLFPLSAHGQEVLTVKPLKKNEYEADIFEDKRQIVPSGDNGLPDGRVTLARGNDIIATWYNEPTDRYDHGALGDKIEAGRVNVKVKNGPSTGYRVPKRQVFEDIAPRLVDLDGDGKMEVVTIISETDKGASIGVFGLQKDKPLLEARASSGFIGKGSWLNIIAFSNFTGPRMQIAYVVRPHVEGKLVIADYVPGQFLVKAAEMYGVSNHKFGSNELRLSAIADFNGDKRGDIIIPSFDRKSLLVIAFEDGKLQPIARADFSSPIDKAIRVEGSGKNMRFVVGLEDGSVQAVSR